MFWGGNTQINLRFLIGVLAVMTYQIAAIRRGSTFQFVDSNHKVIFKRIDDRVTKQLQAIVLHEVDLHFCRYCLNELKSLDCEKQSELAEAFWISCIARFFKCFGNSKARFQLSATKIFRTNPQAKEVFKYFQALRDKHIVHDENPFSQAFVVIAINASEHGNSVAEVFVSPIHLFMINTAELERLRQLIDTTFAWVSEKRVNLEKKLAVAYGQLTRDRLLALPDWTTNAPDPNDVFITR